MNFSFNNKSLVHTKYSDIKYQFVSEKILDHIICVEYISLDCMLKDSLTKGLVAVMYHDHATTIDLAKSFDI